MDWTKRKHLPLLLVLLSFCASVTACDQAESPYNLEVLAVRPADSAAAVPTNVLPTFWLSKPLGADASFEVLLHGGADSSTLHCYPNEDGSALECPLDVTLEKDQEYELTIDLGDDGEVDASSLFDTGMPDGPAYDIGQNLEVVKAGGSDLAARLFQDSLVGETTMLLQIKEFEPQGDVLPWGGDFLVGRGYVRPQATDDGEVVVDGEYGFSLATKGVIRADGGFRASADHATLPVEVDGNPIYLLLHDVVVAGTISLGRDFESLEDVTISGYVPMSSMEELAAAFPSWAEALGDLFQVVDPDVDLNGDGHKDACTLEIEGDGIRVQLIEPQEMALDDE